MKKILVILLCTLLLSSSRCGSDRSTYGVSSDRIMYDEISGNYTEAQIDSLFTVESLPRDINFSWVNSSSLVINGSTRSQFVYIQNDSTMFIITDLDSLTNFKKRVVRTKK